MLGTLRMHSWYKETILNSPRTEGGASVAPLCPQGLTVFRDSLVVCVAESWGSWHLGLQGARAEEGGGQMIEIPEMEVGPIGDR